MNIRNVVYFQFGWFAHPIFSTEGDYPAIMKKRITDISRKQNFTFSRLPPLSLEEIKLLKGSADFLGLNHYNTWLISNHEFSVTNPPSFIKDKGTLKNLTFNIYNEDLRK